MGILGPFDSGKILEVLNFQLMKMIFMFMLKTWTSIILDSELFRNKSGPLKVKSWPFDGSKTLKVLNFQLMDSIFINYTENLDISDSYLEQ